MVKFANVAQKWILEKNQFLQQINLRVENEKTVTRYFNPNELKEPPDKNNIESIPPQHIIFAISLLRASFPFSECNIDFDVIGLTESGTKGNQIDQLLKPQIVKSSSVLQKVLMVEHCSPVKVMSYVSYEMTQKCARVRALNPYLSK